MARKPPRDWPSEKELLDLLERHNGRLTEAAVELGCPDSTLRGQLRKAGLLSELARIRANGSQSDEERRDARARFNWPADSELLAKLQEFNGKVEPLAEQFGVAGSTLRRHCIRQGLWAQVEEMRLRDRPTVVSLDPTEGPSEEEILRERVRELESAHRAARKTSVIEERALRRLDEAIEVIKPKYRAARPRPVKPDGRHEFVLLFSDTHAGEVVSEEETLGMNAYDWKIMLDRMARIQQSVLSYQTHRPYPVPTLHVCFLGDMLSGSIHDELAQTNEMTDAEGIVQFAYDSATWLEAFTPHFENITVTGVPGNHPRRSKKPTAKRAFNNDDWLAYKAVEMLLKDHPNFSFDLPRADFASIQVAKKWRALLMHGDGIKSSMPGVPWGGVVRRVTTLEQQFSAAKQPLDYVFMGHFHTRNMLDGVGVETILNGSVKGLDEYSLKKFGSGRRPSQVLLTFHERKGLTDVSRIDCVDPVPAAAPALAA